MTDRVLCDSCKQMVLTEWPHSCYDADAVQRLHDAERKVIEAAVATFQDTTTPAYDLERALESAVAELRALSTGHQGGA